MRAVVVQQAGGTEVLRLEERPVPEPAQGQVLIRVKAFGLNRSELYTRLGHSPTVRNSRASWGSRRSALSRPRPAGEFAPRDDGRDRDGRNGTSL